MSHQTDEVRPFRDVQHTDALIREYRPVPGQRLYAYRDDGDHIVVSKGDEPNEQWVRRFPATLERPIESQRRWTIPDNWQLFAKSTRDTIAYGMYYIPEIKQYALVSIPTNDHVIDAWYQINAVGELTCDPVGELGDEDDAWDVWSTHADDNGDEDDVVRALARIAENWDVLETELEFSLEIVCDEQFPNPGEYEHVHADEEWVITLPYYYVRFQEALERDVDVSGVDDRAVEVAFDELRSAGLLPRTDAVTLTIDPVSQDTEHVIRGLIEAGASPPVALDAAMIRSLGFTQTEWAGVRGVDQSTVSENVRKAREVLDGKY